MCGIAAASAIAVAARCAQTCSHPRSATPPAALRGHKGNSSQGKAAQLLAWRQLHKPGGRELGQPQVLAGAIAVLLVGVGVIAAAAAAPACVGALAAAALAPAVLAGGPAIAVVTAVPVACISSIVLPQHADPSLTLQPASQRCCVQLNLIRQHYCSDYGCCNSWGCMQATRKEAIRRASVGVGSVESYQWGWTQSPRPRHQAGSPRRPLRQPPSCPRRSRRLHRRAACRPHPAAHGL